LASAGRAGTGVARRRSQGKGAESRPGLQFSISFSFSFCFCFCFCFVGGERGGLTSWPRPGGGIPLYICHGRKAAVRNMKKQNKHHHQLAAAHTDDYMASMGTNGWYTRAKPEGNRSCFGGDMIFHACSPGPPCTGPAPPTPPPIGCGPYRRLYGINWHLLRVHSRQTRG
jgi:hypothetical protein